MSVTASLPLQNDEQALQQQYTHGLYVTPYSGIDIGQHWSRKWPAAWWHQVITWTTDLVNKTLINILSCCINQIITIFFESCLQMISQNGQRQMVHYDAVSKIYHTYSAVKWVQMKYVHNAIVLFSCHIPILGIRKLFTIYYSYGCNTFRHQDIFGISGYQDPYGVTYQTTCYAENFRNHKMHLHIPSFLNIEMAQVVEIFLIKVKNPLILHAMIGDALASWYKHVLPEYSSSITRMVFIKHR